MVCEGNYRELQRLARCILRDEEATAYLERSNLGMGIAWAADRPTAQLTHLVPHSFHAPGYASASLQ